MSIATELTRIQQAKADLKTAIEAKGVTVPSSATIDTYDDYVSQISGGGESWITSIPQSSYTATTFNPRAAIMSVDIPSGVTSIDYSAFSNYTSLTSVTIPNSVTSIDNFAFAYCTSLTSIDIPSSVTSIGNYAFQSCSSLTSVIIGDGVTSISGSVFTDCVSLTSVTIPNSVTTLGGAAFYRCSGLTNVTIGTGITNIGSSVFLNCSGLTGVTIEAVTPPTLGNNVFNNTNDCPIYVPCGSVNAYKAAWSAYESRITCTPHDYSQDYLTFRALEDGTFSFSGTNAASANILEYSVDSGTTWNTLQNSGTTPTVTSGNTILWKASGLNVDSTAGIGTFYSTKNFDIEGNIMSLLFGDNFRGQTTISNANQFRSLFLRNEHVISAPNLVLPATTLVTTCYRSLFYECPNLTTAPQLPAINLANDCYRGMFYGCTSLTTAPSLPATTLTTNCYAYMFQGCTSLTTAPELPATTLASTCYYAMFSGCTNLNSITCLATDISASNCTSYWVENVAANGTFTKTASMTSWTTGIHGIPSNWTVLDYSS